MALPLRKALVKTSSVPATANELTAALFTLTVSQ